MTNTLSECPYCKRPADERGNIFHVGGCTALQAMDMNRLQYDVLQAELANVASRNREIERLRKGLNDAAYALFQIKRMLPEAIVEHSKTAYDKASAVLDGDAIEPVKS
jgi:hypothetical protein